MQNLILSMASYIGIVSFTLSGILVGIRKELDILGIFILALLTATGGGIIRDVLIDKIPDILIHSTPIYIILLVTIMSYLCQLHKLKNIDQKSLFVICDSIGLVAFSIIGAMIGITQGLGVCGVMGLAFITAVGGGIIRDVLINEIPLVLKSDFYGSVSLIIALSLYLLVKFHLLNPIGIGIVLFLGLLIRLLAYMQRWQLPKFTMNEPK